MKIVDRIAVEVGVSFAGRRVAQVGLAFLLVLLLTGTAAADPPAPEAPGAGVEVEAAGAGFGQAPRPPAVDLAALPPWVRLSPAAVAAAARLDELRSWNREGRLPVRVGFTRPLPRPHTVELTGLDLAAHGASFRAGGSLTVDEQSAVWAGVVEVEAAHALRARLRIDAFPAGTTLWTRGDRGEVAGPYGAEAIGADGTLWLPPVDGPRVSIEIVAPRSALEAGWDLRVHVDEVMELVDLSSPPSELSASHDLAPRAATPCEIDGRCVGSGTLSVIADYRHAVARLLFSDGAFSYLCSGSLVNDTDESTRIPYLLTANHCFSTQASASSLVAYFDYFPPTCNGTPPSLGSLPSVSGSTLLATGSTSDFTLVRLSSLPAGYSYLLGWTTRTLAEGETLYMLSHPEGRRQALSTSQYTAFPSVSCGSFYGLFYADQVAGSTLGGSSGAPAIVDDGGGQIVGQLLGACLAPGWSDCDYSSYNEVDGEFRITFPSVAQWLDPPKPTLTVEAIDDTAAEPGDTGGFRITRTVDLASALPVTVALAGTAGNGTDFEAIVSPVTIPAGQASVDVAVVPIDDTVEEGSEQVILELVSSPGFVVGSPASATIGLADDDGADCRSVVVAAQTLGTGAASACSRLHAGPDLEIAGAGDVRLAAGRSVVLYDGFFTGPGASLTVSTCDLELCVSGDLPSSSGCHPCVEQVCAADAYCCDVEWDTICVGAVASVCGLGCP